MKKNIWEWIVYLILFIWQILQNLIGIGFWIYFKLRGDLEAIVTNKYSKVYRSKYMSGGISLGCFAFVSNYYSNMKTVILHEQGHFFQSKLLGIFYLPTVGISSLIHAWLHDPKKSCYYNFWCEAWSNKVSGLGVDKLCRLYIKERTTN